LAAEKHKEPQSRLLCHSEPSDLVNMRDLTNYKHSRSLVGLLRKLLSGWQDKTT